MSSRSADELGGHAWRAVGAFVDPAAAQSAADALRSAAVAQEAITVAGGPRSASPVREREERFLGRLVLIVVAWSIFGTGIGVVMGLVFNALGVGPGGTGGLLIQVASWAVFAHLIAGLWAGYALLTKGESREPVRHIEGGRVVVSVWSASAELRDRAAAALRDAGASAVWTYDADGRRIDAPA